MGGFVNFAIRRDGAVATVLSTTDLVGELFNPDLYLGVQADVDRALSVFRHVAQSGQSGAALFAPHDYGMVVLDFDTKTVVDMQDAEWPRMCHLMLPGRKAQYLQRLGQMGWLGNALYSGMTGNALDVFPPGVFEDQTRLQAWMREQVTRDLRKSARETPEDWFDANGMPVLDDSFVSFCLQPPLWSFTSFFRPQAQEFQTKLRALGFAMTPEEEALWAQWINKHKLG